MSATMTDGEVAQLSQTIEMFEVISQSQPCDYQSLEILKEAYSKLGRDGDVVATSKRIAQAYVQLGQLSSAILEYETVLQRVPEDREVQAALREIETKANGLDEVSANVPANGESSGSAKPLNGAAARKAIDKTAQEIDDGRQAMHKIFVDGKIISAADFESCWKTPDIDETPEGVIEPFVQLLADKGMQLVDKSIKVLIEKSRLAYMPLDKYDIDIDLTRSFSADVCRRWCVLPFDRMSKTVLVATANPFNRQVAKELTDARTSRILYYLTTPQEITANLRKIFR